MKIPIRVIGIATTFFWLFLIVFFISAVYSFKDVKFGIGEPHVALTSGNELLFSLPITIDNRGYYSIGAFNVTTEISDKDGFRITRGSTLIPVIETNRKTVLIHNLTMKTNELLQISQDYLFNDTELKVQAIVGLELAEVIPVQASKNFSVDWGAPLYNFAIGKIEYTASNVTHATTHVPVSFENHAFFDMIGNVQVRMYNSTDVLLGEGRTAFVTAQNEQFQGEVTIDVSRWGITDSGYFELSLSTPIFEFEPLVFPYG